MLTARDFDRQIAVLDAHPSVAGRIALPEDELWKLEEEVLARIVTAPGQTTLERMLSDHRENPPPRPACQAGRRIPICARFRTTTGTGAQPSDPWRPLLN